ncbi:MAG: hypothetical protein V1701_10155 [Planctomycetota bacterium]
MQTKEVKEKIIKLGEKLKFDVHTEFGAVDSGWPDLVWFDNRIKLEHFEIEKPQSRGYTIPLIPFVGFELEGKSSAKGAKHIKGSIANIDSLSPLVGIIVVPTEAVDRVRRYVNDTKSKTRIVVLSEDQIEVWANKVCGTT